VTCHSRKHFTAQRSPRLRRTVLAGAAACVLAAGSGYAQDAADASGGGPGAAAESPERAATPTSAPREEVVVRARSKAFVRQQIRLAEEAVYTRFNEINSTDDFDIHCYREVHTGSRIPVRECVPNYYRDALRRAGIETARSMQGSASLPITHFAAQATVQGNYMESEFRALAASDEELSNALIRLVGLHDRLAGRDTLRTTDPEPVFEIKTADQEELPYGARRMADVYIARDPWEHDLDYRTFAFANVFGEITGVRVDCDNHAADLAFEAESEWTLPDEWGRCAVRVSGLQGSAFSLFEFEGSNTAAD